MADLLPVYDELRRRLSGYAAGFRETSNLTDANATGSRKADEPDDLAYALLGAPTDWSDPSAITQGLCAMQWTGLWTFPALVDALSGDFGVTAWPKLSDSVGAPSVPVGAYGEAVSAKSKDVDAAKAFAKWLWVDKTDYQLDFAQSYGFHIPSRASLVKKADQLKNDFVQRVSYELRSPLTNIIGFTELLDAGTDGHPLAVDLELSRPLQKRPPARAGGLVADQQHRVPVVGQSVPEVVQHAPSRRHAAAGDDDQRADAGVELLDLEVRVLELAGQVADLLLELLDPDFLLRQDGRAVLGQGRRRLRQQQAGRQHPAAGTHRSGHGLDLVHPREPLHRHGSSA